MACPFFAPIERANDLALPHPARLPLGAAWRGTCAVPGCGDVTPTAEELEGCNLGYAKKCSRLPAQRAHDAVRFGVANDSGERVSVQFVFEVDYRPAGQGLLDLNGPPPPAGFCFPVGIYPPGTIVDADIRYNTFGTFETKA